MLKTNTIPQYTNKGQHDLHLQTRWITPDLIAYIVEKIVQEVAPQQVILFGSYAQDEATGQSDLDLFIMQDSEESNRKVRRRIENLLWGRRFGIDLVVRKPGEIQRNLADGNPFYTDHLFKDGKVLYERAA